MLGAKRSISAPAMNEKKQAAANMDFKKSVIGSPVNFMGSGCPVKNVGPAFANTSNTTFRTNSLTGLQSIDFAKT